MFNKICPVCGIKITGSSLYMEDYDFHEECYKLFNDVRDNSYDDISPEDVEQEMLTTDREDEWYDHINSIKVIYIISKEKCTLKI